jgi:hypothetical protein
MDAEDIALNAKDRVIMTYGELFSFASNAQLIEVGANPWYLNEGGSKREIISINLYQWDTILRLPLDERERRKIELS